MEDLRLTVVMPDGARGWYTDSATRPAGGGRDVIVRDLVGL